ncbi:MAG: hypothetical protein ACE5HR_00060 [bacterium]
MLFLCEKCGRIRKFGKWSELPEHLILTNEFKAVPKTKMTCDDCKDKKLGLSRTEIVRGGGCEGLREVRKQVVSMRIGDCLVGALLLVLIISVVWCGIVSYKTWAVMEKSKCVCDDNGTNRGIMQRDGNPSSKR